MRNGSRSISVDGEEGDETVEVEQCLPNAGRGMALLRDQT